jgi:phage terminase large subunit-like protein
VRFELTEELLAFLPAEECERLYRAIRYRWPAWARPKQLPPDTPFDVWGLVAGRGAGKTRPGSEWTVEKAKRMPGARWALVGRTSADVRDTMVLGESGIMSVSPPWFRPRHYPSKRVVVWPNGFEAHLYSADEPDLLRGPQHHGAWGDEFAAWRRPDAWSNLQDGLRLGERPEVLLTTTPRRTDVFLDTFLGPKDNATGKRLVTPEMVASGAWEHVRTTKDHFGRLVEVRTIVHRWATEENALNLAPGFAAKRRAAYGDSSYGRMELDAEILELVEGALFRIQWIDASRVPRSPAHHRRVVALDPSHSGDGRYDECGIVVAGIGPSPDGKGSSPHGYVLADRSLKASPLEWGLAAVNAYDEFRCDLIIYESNASPGKPDVVPDVLRTVDPRSRIRWVPVHASRDKRTRADPVASLYEQGRVHHVEDPEKPSQLAMLEEELVGWNPWDPQAPSPNRLDALVHGLSYLLLQAPAQPAAPESLGTRPSPWRT